MKQDSAEGSQLPEESSTVQYPSHAFPRPVCGAPRSMVYFTTEIINLDRRIESILPVSKSWQGIRQTLNFKKGLDISFAVVIFLLVA